MHKSLIALVGAAGIGLAALAVRLRQMPAASAAPSAQALSAASPRARSSAALSPTARRPAIIRRLRALMDPPPPRLLSAAAASRALMVRRRPALIRRPGPTPSWRRVVTGDTASLGRRLRLSAADRSDLSLTSGIAMSWHDCRITPAGLLKPAVCFCGGAICCAPLVPSHTMLIVG